MTKKIKSYRNRKEFLIDAKKESKKGFRMLHYNFPHEVTYVKGSDDPANNQPVKEQMTRTAFVNRLAENQNVVLS